MYKKTVLWRGMAAVLACLALSTCELLGLRVAIPETDPAPGTYPGSCVAVRLTCATAGAAIHYTTDGSDPTEASPRYVEPIPVSASFILKAVGVAPDRMDSRVATAEYVIVDTQQTLAGVLFHNGAPMSEYTSVPAYFWLRDEETGQGIQDIVTFYDPTTGRYGLANVPDHEVGISVSFHVTDDDNSNYPGNYDVFVYLDLAALTTAEELDYPISLTEIIHLVEPHDNATQAVYGTYPVHTSPVLFRWEPIEAAAAYHVSISRYIVEPEYFYLESVVSEDLVDTRYTAVLDPLSEDQIYEFWVGATNTSGEWVGSFTVVYDYALGWDYRFRVE